MCTRIYVYYYYYLLLLLLLLFIIKAQSLQYSLDDAFSIYRCCISLNPVMSDLSRTRHHDYAGVHYF